MTPNKTIDYYNENLEDEFTNPESILVDYIMFENIINDDDSLEVILNEDQRQKADDFAILIKLLLPLKFLSRY